MIQDGVLLHLLIVGAGGVGLLRVRQAAGDRAGGAIAAGGEVTYPRAGLMERPSARGVSPAAPAERNRLPARRRPSRRGDRRRAP